MGQCTADGDIDEQKANGGVFKFGGRFQSKNFRERRRAAMVIAAGSVIKEPRIGAKTRSAIHQAKVFSFPSLAIWRKQFSAKFKIGRVDAIIIMMTTNIGSV